MVGIVHLSYVLALVTAEAQQSRPSGTAAPSERIATPADPGSRTATPDTSAASTGPNLVFTGFSGAREPGVRVTGWPAGLIIFAFFAGLAALLWRLFHLRRRSRSLAQRSDTQYRLLFEQNPCPMLVYDTRTLGIFTANHAAAALVGYTTDALEQLAVRDLFPMEVAADAVRALSVGTGGHQDAAVMTRMRRQDGSIIDVDARARPLDARVGHGRLMMMLDVTERLAGERALRDAEQRARTTSEVLRSLIDVAPQAIVAMNHDHRVTLWNRAAEELFGWSAAEVLGTALPYVPPEERAGFLARLRIVDQRGSVRPSDVTRMHRNGTRIELFAASGVVGDADGSASGYINVFADLTQHRILEAQLRQSQKLEAVGRLAGGIAHDFNNVLTIISSYVQMLQAQHDGGAESEDLAEIARAAARGATLTRQLLIFSRKEIVQLSVVNINDVITQIYPMLRRVSEESIDLRTVLAPTLGTVLADAGQLEQVILNLALNAADAMPDGGALVFETANVDLDDDYVLVHPEVIPGPYVMLAASDTGCGMNEATQAKIFEPFFTTKEPGRGTGLGLAMAYEIVRQAGGHIWVYSEVSHGATFRIFLPCVDAAATGTEGGTGGRCTPTVGRGGTVLLVDDDDAARRSLRSTLVRLGYVVLEAADGDAGLKVVERQGGTIDVVVTDLTMPGLSGREFAERLTQAQPRLRVVFTSGYTGDEVARRRMLAEGQPFLQKPFTSEQLVNAIHALQPSLI